MWCKLNMIMYFTLHFRCSCGVDFVTKYEMYQHKKTGHPPLPPDAASPSTPTPPPPPTTTITASSSPSTSTPPSESTVDNSSTPTPTQPADLNPSNGPRLSKLTESADLGGHVMPPGGSALLSRGHLANSWFMILLILLLRGHISCQNVIFA